jgi:hypothetical protein
MVDAVVVVVVEGWWEFAEPAFFGTTPEREREEDLLYYRNIKPLSTGKSRVAGLEAEGLYVLSLTRLTLATHRRSPHRTESPRL